MTQPQPTPDSVASNSSEGDETTFESSLAALEQVVHGLEDGRNGLDQSLQLYEQGIQHLQRCFRLLNSAEQKIELLTSVDEAGQATTEPFASTTGGELAEKTTTRSRKRPRAE